MDFPEPLPAEREGEHWWFEQDGREVRLSNLDKVFWPDNGYTKGDVVAYYYNVRDLIVPYLRDRPLTLKRMPHGAFGDFFYEKEAPPTTPAWMPGCEVESAGTGEGRWGPVKHERIHYLMVDAVAALLFVANLGAIEFHPLHSRCGSIETPDYLFFDLDPFEPAAYPEVLAVARLIKVVCDRLDLVAYPKTSGATGMQIYVPLEPKFTYDQVRDFVGQVGRLILAADPDRVILAADPDRVTMEWEVRKQTGKGFIDHNMNRVGANIAAVYSVRPEPGATVSTPLSWDEVEEGEVRASDFTIASVWERFRSGPDPFRGVLDHPQDITHALEALGLPVHAEPPRTESRPFRFGPDWAASKPPGPGVPKNPGTPARPRRRETSQDVAARSKDPKLGQYLKMREFGETGTPEPATGKPSEGGNFFVIQRHDATRLHYDLRLERDGVLVSWAVPKGLPRVHGERHLAVHTEDHPMEYASFEGTIPEGHYGAGEVRIWDRGTYDLLEWADKKVSFRLHGQRHNGEYHLVKTGRGGEKDWLILLGKASEEDPLPKPPRFAPMLATGGYQPFDAEGWWFEPKFDGIRTLLYMDGEDIRLISRTGRDQTEQYPELPRVFRRITATNAVLDGEIVATDDQGRTSFERLQQRMNLVGKADIERMTTRVPVEMVAFDMLWLDGEDLTGLPLGERRERLTATVVEGRGLRLMFGIEKDGAGFFEAAKQNRLEGIIAKRLASRYQPGRRTDDWRKIKILKRQDCVVLGWTPGQGGRGGTFGALLLGAYRDGKLIWIGQVGTGFTDQMVRDIMGRLRELEQDEPPVKSAELRRVKGARWVRPELVCEVEYLQITGSGKLRAPSFKGFRPDKLPEDCLLEQPAEG